MEPRKKLEELKAHLLEVNAISSANAVLAWDQQTYMPPGGAPARGRQMSVLAMLAQKKFIDPVVGKLLDDLRPYEESLPYDDDDASLIRITRRDYERSIRIPPEFTGRLNAHATESFQVWADARPKNDFTRVLPFLEKTLDLSREYANFFPGYDHVADPLIGFADYGMKAETVRSLFADLRARQVPIVKAILDQEPADDSCIRRNFPEAQQMVYCGELVKCIGFDYERGSLDKTHHPFTINISIGDVRITTRVREDYLSECLFSNIHEAGHALYEQGVDMKYEGLPLGQGLISGVHESQSRLWENLVGRSRDFWDYHYPGLQNAFPEQFKGVTLEAFYRAINKVERSLIRTDADEVTYNLHIMLRFDFELQMLEGKLAVKDLPEAWRERFRSDFGIMPPDDRNGVMQDVHWFDGFIGGVFQGYTLGNVMSTQFFEAALKEHPGITDEIRAGSLSTLHNWLIENIYRHGRKYTLSELVRRATGFDLSIEPYISYLKRKFGELYKL